MRPTPAPVLSARLRRTLLAATGVIALAVASFATTEVSGARPLEIEVAVTATATPGETVVGDAVTVAGTVADLPYEVGSLGDPRVAGCSAGDTVRVATSCIPDLSGDVDVVVDEDVVDSVTLDGAGAFSWSTTELSVGTHEIVVTYPGDEYRLSGASDPMVVEVTEPVPAPTGAYRDGTASLTTTPGGTIEVSGGGWQADTEVTATLRSDPVVLGTSVAGADGSIAASYVIPAATPTGAHTLTLTGTGADGQPGSVVLSLSVVAAAAAPSSPAPAPAALSFTG